ncbi:hypothetical protein QUF75_08120 [Desulfococcaceae bacterium HSG7]|nr:hypothetical protein [Desulfococcaceae bacterium HSG7]
MKFEIDEGDKSLVQEISLEQLVKLEKLSVRTINVCKNNGFDYLHDILNHYKKNRTFLKFKNCGAKTERELIHLCLKYSDYDSCHLQEQDNEDELAHENLSIRAINVCKNNELNSIEAILKHYKEYKTFRNFDNCGSKTEKELVEIYHKYSDTKELELSQVNFNNLNKLQRFILNQYFKSRIKSLSNRTINCLSSIDPNIDDFRSFYKVFSTPDFSIINLKNVGKKTKQEFDDFCNDIFSLADLLQSQVDAQEFFNFFVSVVTKDLDVDEKFIEDFASDFFEEKFPLFRFIDFLIKNGYIYSDRELQIFYHRSNYCADKEIFTLEKLGEKTSSQDKLTRERVRQLAEKINPILEGKLSHLFMCFPYTNYNISFNEDQDFIHIDNEFANRINMAEGVNFTPKFYARIFSIFMGDSHTLCPDSLKNEANIYLIKKELFEYFDFDDFYQDIEQTVNRRILDTYSIHFEGYLCGFLKTDDISLLERISPICETILFEAFNLFLDLDGNVIIEKNIKIKSKDYALKVLEEYGKPMHLKMIYDHIISMYPDMKLKIESVRRALSSSEFIYFGNSSTYGLKKWEYENDSIKGGTHKDIAEQFLEKFDEPKHISDIYSYVRKFRDTNERNVLLTIKSGNNRRFVFFYGSYVGLKSKKYTNTDSFSKNQGNWRKISKEDLIECYYELKEKVGHNPTSTEMHNLGRYSRSPYDRCFGSWNKFLESIGESRKIIISKDDLINAYYGLKEKLGRRPTSRDMADKGKYSLAPYLNKFGSWKGFLKSIGENKNRIKTKKRNISSSTTGISEQALIEAYKNLKEKLGHSPTSRDMNCYGMYNVSIYYSKFGSWSRFLKNIGESSRIKSIPKKNLIEAYFDLKNILAKNPTSTEIKKYGKYSLKAYNNQFGSWNKFLESIGERTRSKSISEKELFDAYYLLKEKLGRIPTATEMNELGKYSASVYYSRFGGWKKFLKYIDEDDN